MKMTYRLLLIAFFCFLLSSCLWAVDLEIKNLSDTDFVVLKSYAGVAQLFQQFPDSLWPGYDLSKTPFIVYTPEWVLLFNHSNQLEGFGSYPQNWPDLKAKVLFYPGQYKDLAGQLAFDLPIDTFLVCAVPFEEKPEVDFFAFIVHEAFHQYQSRVFSETRWAREELYPIQDQKNTALAYLEMRLLMDALKMAKLDNKKKCKEYVKQFVAVRDHRWKTIDPFVARYEQMQEIHEGTAAYVEAKSIDLMTRLKARSSLDTLAKSILEDFSKVAMPQHLLDNFQVRITEGSISPEDMSRNRIYPVGAAQGLLLDYFKIDWKSEAQKADSQFTYAKLLGNYLGLNENQYQSLLQRAEKRYDYKKVLASSEKLIEKYNQGFDSTLKVFEAQTGYRVEVDLSLNLKNLVRSRSSSDKKWLVDKGTRELHGYYEIYSLISDALLLQIHNTGVLEQNNWDKRIRKVVFFAQGIDSLSVDGELIKPQEGASYQFTNIEMVSKDFKLSYSKAGKLAFLGKNMIIDLINPK